MTGCFLLPVSAGTRQPLLGPRGASDDWFIKELAGEREIRPIDKTFPRHFWG
jgi:hypothetical protein